MRINEVAPRQAVAQGGDWIELYVATTTLTDMQGWTISFLNGGPTLKVSSITLTALTTAQAYVVIHLSTSTEATSPADENDGTGDTNLNGYWDIYIGSDTVNNADGLQGTDNVLVLRDNTGLVIDGMVYSNGNATWSGNTAANNLLQLLVSTGQWSGPASVSAVAAERTDQCGVTYTGTTAGVGLHRDQFSTDNDNVGFRKSEWGVRLGLSTGAANADPTDYYPPAAITDLDVTAQSASSLTLQWTVPSAGASTDTLKQYYVRYTSATLLGTVTDFFAASNFTSNVTDFTAGNSTGIVVNGLLPATTYWFAVVAEDDGDAAAGNFKWGGLPTNLPVSGLTSPDTEAPAAITDFVAVAGSTMCGAVNLTWTAPSDPPTGGAATKYIVRFATTSAAEVGWSSSTWWAGATDVPLEPTPAVPGTAQAWTLSGLPSGVTCYFHIRSQDAVNISSSQTNAEQYVYIQSHLLISQIKLGTAELDFVELYNPSTNTINLQGLPLYYHRRTNTGTDTNVALTYVNTSIAPHSFFVFAPDSTVTGGVAPDATNTVDMYSGNSSIYISLSATELVNVIDVLGTGTANSDPYIDYGDANAPTRFTPNPATGAGLIRRPAGGLGHATDTNKWTGDFMSTATPVARNSLSTPEPDPTAPAAVTNLFSAKGLSGGEINLYWTAPGDDGGSGAITGGQYDLRYATFSVSGGDTASWWGHPSVTSVLFSTTTSPGATETRTVVGLTTSTIYYFAIKTKDESGNWSAIDDGAAVSQTNTPPKEASGGSYSALGANAVMAVDNFDDGDLTNLLGKGCAIFEVSGATTTLTVTSSPAADMFGRRGYVLKVHYEEDGASWAGFWNGLQGIDLTGYRYLSFWIRGEAGGEMVKVGLKNNGGQENPKPYIYEFLPGGITTSWRKVVIPFTAFGTLTSFSNMDSIMFVIDEASSNGTVYIDDIVLGKNGAPGWIDNFSDGNTTTAFGAGNDVFAGGAGTSMSRTIDGDGYRDSAVKVAWGGVTPFNNKPGWWISAQNNNASSPHQGLDARGTTGLSFYVKGSPAGASFYVGVKDLSQAGWAIEKKVLLTDYLPGGVTGTYQEVRIPVTALADPDVHVEGLESLSLEPLTADATVYLDEFVFIDTAPPSAPFNLQDDGNAVANSHVFGSTNILTLQAARGDTDKSLESVRVEYSTDSGSTWVVAGRDYDVGNDTYTVTWYTTGLSTTASYDVRGVAEDVNGSTGVMTAFTGCSVVQDDTTPPAAVTNLFSAKGLNSGETYLYWTAPGDDGTAGAITGGEYEIRYAAGEVGVGLDTTTWWNNAAGTSILFSTTTAPGSTESRTVVGLTTSTTYYFAIKTKDETGNWSAIDALAASNSQNWSRPREGTAGSYPALGANGVLVLDQFDDGDTTNALGWAWGTYKESGGEVTISPWNDLGETFGRGGYSLKMNYTHNGSPSNKLLVYGALNAADLSAYNYVSFWVMGST
ncbi:MAG TPA: fibronectin type III domain-containing protein, partial [Elusimicrobiota bacterium]|nr:fibronectin type III domain-containing protein [Elusimicrobiota bacterium]